MRIKRLEIRKIEKTSGAIGLDAYDSFIRISVFDCERPLEKEIHEVEGFEMNIIDPCIEHISGNFLKVISNSLTSIINLSQEKSDG